VGGRINRALVTDSFHTVVNSHWIRDMAEFYGG
jgi:hypothetical protein